MTSNAAFKKRVRQLATQLNIPYAEARTRLQQAHDKPVFARSGVIIHPNPSAQPPTYFQTEASGKISLDRIEGANPRDRLPPYSADVCEALNRLALVAAIRRHPRLKSFFGTQVSSDTVYFAIDARKADREILAAVMYQAWLGNAKPAYDLADQWRAEIDPANGWHWNIARQFGEDPGDPPPPNREPRRRRPNLGNEQQKPYADLAQWPRDEDGVPILQAEVQHSSGVVSLLTGPCPYCGRQHEHGGSLGLVPGDNAGLRASHCSRHAGAVSGSYALVVATSEQIHWPSTCQALTHKGAPCRKPAARRDGRSDVLCSMHRDDFHYRTATEEPVRWNRLAIR